MKKLFALILMAALAACGKSDDSPTYAAPPMVQAQPQGQAPQAQAPIVIQNGAPAAQPDNTMSNMMVGGALGYLLGSSNNNRPAPQVVERTTIIERQAPTPLPATATPAPRPVVVAKPAPPVVAPALRPAPTMPPVAPAKPSYAPAQPYVQRQNTPTYTAPPKPYSPPSTSSSRSTTSSPSRSSGKR